MSKIVRFPNFLVIKAFKARVVNLRISILGEPYNSRFNGKVKDHEDALRAHGVQVVKLSKNEPQKVTEEVENQISNDQKEIAWNEFTEGAPF